MEKEKEDIKEITELKHDPEPGYSKIFYIAFSIGLLYLGIIFLFG